ncbi:rhodanese-like domain-containing protein [Zavarzinella formosa]|uniref:rhodanese-like domain-containing protein n=1 Tax=Zavarzinella formosa TaxID=360055 RepID=UPI0002EE4F50|nr:rhodanese-like domain-containing protein [Zavarzinella formosa]
MSQTMPATISPNDFVALKRAGKILNLIDVRTPVEYRSIHAEGARSIPLDRLDAANVSQSEPIYVICHTGGRAAKACEMLKLAGNPNVVNVEGGTKAWEEAGLPVVRGKKAMSLERQVRIAAGSLVLIGVALGFLVHEYLFGLSGFVGAGLVFAGVTDTCGMGMLFARMPWNQVGQESQGQCAT